LYLFLFILVCFQPREEEEEEEKKGASLFHQKKKKTKKKPQSEITRDSLRTNER